MNYSLDKSVLAGLGLVVALLLGSAALTYHNTRRLDEDDAWVAHTHAVRTLVAGLLRTLVDAETGERGFILTGMDEFLQPYDAALQRLDGQTAILQEKTKDNPRQQENINRLQPMVVTYQALLKEGIDLRRRSEPEAKAFIATGKGKAQMDAIRSLVAEMDQGEQDLLLERNRRSQTPYAIALTTNFLTAALGVLMVVVLYRLLLGNLITHRKATDALREQKNVAERQAKLLDLAHDGIFIRDLESRIAYWNQGASAMYGWDTVQALGQVTHQLLHTEFPEPLKEIEEQVFRLGQWEGELVHTRQDGSQIVVASRWGLQRDMHGKPQAILEINRDITQRKSAEEALRRAHGELERRVLERTAELAQVNEVLKVEVAFRGRAEEELRRQTEALQESETRFHQLVDSIPQLVWVAHADGHIYWYNQRWYDYTGTTLEQMDGWGWQSVHDPDALPKVMEQWRASIATGKPFEMEFPLRGADGRFRTFLTRIMPTRGAGGQVLQWFGTNTDITERKQAEQRLEASERIYRAIGESIDYGVWVCDAEGKNTYVSPSFLRLVGITQEECSEFGWGKHLFADEADRAIAAWKECVRVQGKWDREHRFLGVDKQWYPILSRGVPVRDERGEIIAWAGINLDIGRLKQAEESLRNLNASLEQQVAERTAAAEERAGALAESEAALREQTQLMEAILNSMGEGVVVADVDGRFILFNPAAEAILGIGLTESRPDSWSDVYGIFRPDAKTPLLVDELPLMRAIRGETVDDCEVYVRNARSPGRHLTVTCRPMFTEAGTLRGGVVVFRDITARKQVEEQIKASLREKEFLLKEIHHRVKNNLQIVSTLLDLQSSHTEDMQALEMFKESRGRVRSMALIHERLYRSQDLAHVDLAEYVRQLADDLYHAYRVSNDEIVLDVDVDVRQMSIDIAIPCGLLINELMSNALKHAFVGAREGRLRVALRRVGDNNNVLTVGDTGAGFPPGLDFRDTKSFGLQLVNTLVEQLHGKIELKTDGGAEFTVTFPDMR